MRRKGCTTINQYCIFTSSVLTLLSFGHQYQVNNLSSTCILENKPQISVKHCLIITDKLLEIDMT